MMKKALKGSLAAAAGIALGLGASGIASAQEATPTASGNVVSEEGIGLRGSIDGSQYNVAAHVLGLQLGEQDVRVVYCIQIEVGLLGSAVHEERAWDDVPVEQLPLVLGVLTNGYSGGNADELIDAAGVGESDFEDYSAEQIAYAGTQAAVWSLTDGWVINADDPTNGGEGVDTAVSGIQTYLLDNSEPIDEPDHEPYFETDDADASVEGSTYGPFTVSTNLGSVSFQQPEGATVVDENGDAINQFSNGQSFWVEFDEAESSTVSLVTDTVTWITPVGRAFVPIDGDGVTQEGQNLILAESHEEEIAAELEFEITVEAPAETPSAQPQLPVTGTSLTTVAGVGAAVLAAGVVAMVLLRRRAAAAGADWGSDDK